MKETARKPLVLVIDDIPDWQATLCDLLASLDVRIEAAASIKEAIDVAEHHLPDSDDPIDLVTLDMHLPEDEGDLVDETGGIKFLTQYNLLGGDVPIIVFTAYENYDNCVAAIKAGAYYYFLKADSRPGVNSAARLVDLCRELLFGKKEAEPGKPGQPDREWFERNHHEVRERNRGKFAVFVPADTTVKPGRSVSRAVLDGVKILVSESYPDLRRCIAHNPELLALLPLVIFIEGKEE